MKKPLLLALLLSSISCSPLQQRAGDPVGQSLARHVDGPVLAMANRFGQPSHKTVDKTGRWYFWEFRDRDCTVSARVDGQEVVVDAFWKGNRDGCTRVMDATASY